MFSQAYQFNSRRLLVFVLDIILIALAFSASFLLRFDFRIPPEFQQHYWQGLIVVMTLKPLVFLISGFYRSLWRYASLQDGIEIAKMVSLSSVLAGFVLMFLRNFSPYPRSIFLLDWLLLFTLVASSRLIWRVWRETVILPRSLAKGRRTLIIGAGEAGSMLIKEILRQDNSPYSVIGFVDDDSSKEGMRLHGFPVLGPVNNLQALINSHSIDDVIIAIPSAAGKTVREIVKNCEHCKVRFKILPGISELIEGRVSVSQIKDVEIEDLLGRDPVCLDENAIRGYLGGKRLLVTGAAGSIGSEICRQAARFNPAKLILLDSAETPLYQIEKELSASYPDLRIVPFLADIRHGNRLDFVFETFLPEVVFHAAAYKHVPMLEYNPVEAILNNVLGTSRLAEMSDHYGVKNFVMISTDKAVNPTNVLGASKRAAELFVQSLAQHSKTIFTTVRFGNVLGSNGSVIPHFLEQINAGGPVTVTHPDVIRYFMTIPEASQLVLQAGCIGNGGEIFVLDMGEPVKIVDLAEELISLSGLTPYEDIEIIFTGLRPGEKLFEELLIAGEGIKPTRHPKIKVMDALRNNLDEVRQQTELLAKTAENYDIDAMLQQLREMVPEYSPQYHFEGAPPHVFCRLRPDLSDRQPE